jgi:hypothetical protein
VQFSSDTDGLVLAGEIEICVEARLTSEPAGEVLMLRLALGGMTAFIVITAGLEPRSRAKETGAAVSTEHNRILAILDDGEQRTAQLDNAGERPTDPSL